MLVLKRYVNDVRYTPFAVNLPFFQPLAELGGGFALQQAGEPGIRLAIDVAVLLQIAGETY